MKFLVTILVALLAVSFASATSPFQCGPRNVCQPFQSCVCDHGVFKCVYDCPEVQIVQTIFNRWADNNGNQPSVQVQVDIINRTNRNIKDIIIATDVNLNSNQIWGVDKIFVSNGITVIDLPSYVDIAAHGKYSFGYINRGNSAAHLYVKNVLVN
ncbi:hypothetical protein DICPUDRAFT_31231 [Dictyostelium purpureum]|uniref:Carbohydrate binding domain-containing protein n=1 Tax=Dictyostelium purpureum TaxID=5786 RepID=F0ZGT6_DICPU|nr:uncharacterized protein DICPUDRAFT_31231 [Dictyostelium purpureum]EGC36830.1 hypothetical protein DICPUDRAFT_31231 [Dictyostelium purpureum]|eukprot:XP_003286628.1 hypothetical protein DICPUDRAFT_31231 [Dictyostelium purpureum]